MRYRHTLDLGITLVERKLKIRAARSKLSAALPFLIPAAMLGLYIVIFKGVFRVPIPNYHVYLLAGLLPWIFLTQSILEGLNSITYEADLLKRAPLPYELFPLSSVAAMFLYFCASIVIFAAALGGFGQIQPLLLPFLVVPMVSLFLLVSALSMLLALIDVYNRDIRFLMASALSAWFFLEPIVYRPSMATAGLRWVGQFDPVNSLVGQFREILYYRRIAYPQGFAAGLGVCAALFVVSLTIFRWRAPKLPRDV